MAGSTQTYLVNKVAGRYLTNRLWSEPSWQVCWCSVWTEGQAADPVKARGQKRGKKKAIVDLNSY